MIDLAPFYRLADLAVMAVVAAMVVPLAITAFGEYCRARADVAIKTPRRRP
jgi:hypothetical protein